MKRTSLYETHKAAGATLVPFAGWEMPVSYAGTVAEVAATRTSAGIFDVSHMGEVTVKGTGAFDFVQSVTTNDVSKLAPARAQYSLLLNESGGVIDDIIVYNLGYDVYLIILNAGCKDKDWAWLQAQAEGRPEVVLTDLSDEKALIAVQGPSAVNLASAVINKHASSGGHNTRYAYSGVNLETMRRFSFAGKSLSGTPLLISRTGYTGEDGFEVVCDWDVAPVLWQLFTEAGAVPCGLGARDVLRLEAAYPLYGHELDAENSPNASGTGWAVKMGKGDFTGRAALEGKVQAQQLVGLQMNERAIPREHYKVSDAAGQVIGETTSGTWSPTVKAGIAMARVSSNAAAPGTPVLVDIRGRQVPATITKLPFYRNGV